MTKHIGHMKGCDNPKCRGNCAVGLSDSNALVMRWQPIETAPTEGKKMFVIKAFNVCNGHTDGRPYTSDPYCTWREPAGFARWPHNFEPTHWCALPDDIDA